MVSDLSQNGYGCRREREREREREGPRLRVTTVQKCAALTGSWLPNQASAAPYPFRQAGGGPVALPPGGWAQKIRDEAHTRGSAFIITEGAHPKTDAGFPGG